MPKHSLAVCRSKPALAERQLLARAAAASLAEVFAVLASDSRLRLLHALVRERELGVTELAARMGMTPQAVSNQMRRLADRAIVRSRRDGNGVLWRIVDPCVPALLDKGLCLVEDAEAGRP